MANQLQELNSQCLTGVVEVCLNNDYVITLGGPKYRQKYLFRVISVGKLKWQILGKKVSGVKF